MVELLHKRTYTKKHFDNGDGTFTMKAHAGHIHYRGQDGELKDVDIRFEDKGTYWQMVKHNYKLLIAKDFGANRLIRWQNRFEGANHDIDYEPKMLAWVNNPDMSDMQVFRNQQSVQGELIGDNVIRWTNAFGDGIHFEVTLLRHGFKKEIVIEAKNKLELPPTADHKLVALFKYTGEGLAIKKTEDLSTWDKDSYFETEVGFKIEEAEDKKSFIKPAFISDNAENGIVPNRQLIKVFWKKHNNALWQGKVLPKQFLLNAVYPVRADTVTDYTNESGENQGGYTTASATWATVQADANYTMYEDSILYGMANKTANGGTQFRLNSTMFNIDTSGLPNDATISSASFYYHTNARSSSTGGDYAYIVFVKGYSANPTDVVGTDFGGRTFTAQTETKAITAHASNDWNNVALNETGIGNISKTGYTKFSDVTGWNYENTSSGITSNAENYIQGDMSTYDPYLKITYTEATAFTPKIIII